MLPPEKQTRGFHELAHHHWYDYNYRRHRRPWLLYKNRHGPSLKGHGGRRGHSTAPTPCTYQSCLCLHLNDRSYGDNHQHSNLTKHL